ncbi:MAG: glucose-1-phosphate thymidylyltransferase [Chitinophagaceae bacterium]|nr:glucose-1-phosphate thymidylyltransferase [Chitinophagaceae bacterium]
MKDIILNDKDVKDDLFPFGLIRHVADIRIGILTIREKWERLLKRPVSLGSEDISASGSTLVVAANIIPSHDFISTLDQCNQTNISGSGIDACKIIQYPWHLFQLNDWALREDFKLLTTGRASVPIPETVQVIDEKNVFIEQGAILRHCILNASTGPIYIGKNTEIMEGATIRGPFAICEGAVVKMGARIYGATTIGPYSVVGGEVKNSIIFGYSNKAHDGYLGDSVVGEWCNLGAGTSNSNLKNSAGEVKVYDAASGHSKIAGTKCGLLLGDYSRSAINTTFNTGTVVGVCCNVYGEGLTPAFIPGFSWGYKPVKKYDFQKAIRDIVNWKKLKGKIVTEEDIEQLSNIFNQS